MSSNNQVPVTQVIIYLKYGIIPNKHITKKLLKTILVNKQNFLINNYDIKVNAIHKNDEQKLRKIMEYNITALPALTVNDQVIIGIKHIMDTLMMLSEPQYTYNHEFVPKKKKTGAQMIDELVQEEIEKHKNEVIEEEESLSGPVDIASKVQQEMQKRKEKQTVRGKIIDIDYPEIKIAEKDETKTEPSKRGHTIKPPPVPKMDDDDDMMMRHMNNIGLKKKNK